MDNGWNCPNCGAVLPKQAQQCTYCGTPVGSSELTANQIQQISQFLETINRNFHQSQEQADDHSVTWWIIGSIAVVLLLIVLVVLGKLSIWVGIGLGVLFVFIFFCLSVILTEFWLTERYNRRTYHKSVRPLINHFIADHHLTSSQFLLAANATLSEQENLRRYIFEDFANEIA